MAFSMLLPKDFLVRLVCMSDSISRLLKYTVDTVSFATQPIFTVKLVLLLQKGFYARILIISP